MRFLADLVYLIAGLIYLPIVLYQMVIQGKNRRGWSQRFGFVPRFAPHKKRIWIHAVSLGEINATPRLVESLREQLPDWDVVISTTTDTGFARAVELYGHNRVFRYPLDFSWVVRTVLNRINPSVIVLMELEVWHNLVRTATRRGISVAVVNGRLTERSFRRLGKLGPAVRNMFADIAWVGAQDETIAQRFVQLGTQPDRVEVTSSMKWDSAIVADEIDGSDSLANELGLSKERPLWVCGSTGPGEEALILQAYRDLEKNELSAAQRMPKPSSGALAPRPRLAIVPRKPERFDEVARLIERLGFTCVRRSQRKGKKTHEDAATDGVILGDTMGELRKFYSLADVVFVGRSLVPMGGSDPMEVAALGKAMVIGPHADNFAVPVAALEKSSAIRVVDNPAALASAIGELLADQAEATKMGQRAREVVIANQGATARTCEKIVALCTGEI